MNQESRKTEMISAIVKKLEMLNDEKILQILSVYEKSVEAQERQ